MVYQFANMGPSEGQISDLLKGKTVLLSKEDQTGSVAIPLTKVQHARHLAVQQSGKSMRLKLSAPQIKAMRESGVVGEQHADGFFSDRMDDLKKIGKKVLKDGALPLARMGLDAGLNYAQSKIPTGKLGPAAEIGDSVVKFGRKYLDKGLDKGQEKVENMIGDGFFDMFGGAAGRDLIDAQMGEGWFSDFVLPAVKTAAEIGIPLIRGRGARPIPRMMWQKECDAMMGQGWFSDYLLPTVKTAADIAVPLIRGRGFTPKKPNLTGWGWFSDYLLPAVKTAADIGIPLIRGRGADCCSQCGQGWNMVAQQQPKKNYGEGLRF